MLGLFQSKVQLVEEWKDILGFEELYQVSNLGNVKGLKRGKLLKFGGDRYHIVSLNNCSRKSMLVHRLVAFAFIPNPENKPWINHKDGNRYNNAASNLEWCTHSENIKHAFLTGLIPKPTGSKNGASKLTEQDIPKIKRLREKGLLLKDIGTMFGISAQQVFKICANQIWNHVII
jgi:hypothetical protein